MPLPEQGVGNNRTEALAAILKTREEEIDKELKDGGGEGISVLERGEAVAGPVVKPEGVDQAEWDKLNGEAKAGLAEAEAERVKAEAAAIEGETDEQKVAREKAEADRKAAEAGQTRKLKVDGKEVEFTQAQIDEAGVRALQKETAADKRLEEASRLFKEAQAAVAAAQAGAVQDQNKGGASLPQGGGGAVEVLTDEAFTEAVKKIQYGSETEAAATLKDLITKAARSGQSEQLTLDRVEELLNFREATRWAHDEYKDILGDPKMKALFVSEERRLRAAGDMRPYREVYTDIGNGLQEWKKGLAPAPAEKPAAQGNDLATRRERKAAVVVIPSAAARQSTPSQPKEPSPSEVIDKMRAARRQT